MQQQPPGGYQPPPYGQPPQQGYPPSSGYGYAPMPPQPPPKQGMSTLSKVLLGMLGMGVLMFGSCAVCVGIGAKGASDAAKRASAASQANNTGRTAEPEQTTETPAPAVAETAIQVEVKSLLAEYKNNEVRADQLYKGKLIETTGKVDDVKKSLTDSIYVTVGTGQVFEIPQVQCHPDDNQAGRAAQLNKGDKVTVRGRVSGLMMNVQLRDCEIL
jgi:hypothetical protein